MPVGLYSRRENVLECEKCGLAIGYDGEPELSDWAEVEKLLDLACPRALRGLCGLL